MAGDWPKSMEAAMMDAADMARMLGLEQEVTQAVAEYDRQINYDELSDIDHKFQIPALWEEGVKQLLEYCGEDPLGMKALTVQLHYLTDTCQKYREKGIEEKIFLDTMGFLPRFLDSHRQTWGVSAYTWAWWFPRQLSMNEFRIGEYEYEFLSENGERKLNLHIPSDARMEAGDIRAIYPFVAQYYPEYNDVPIVCDSWLLSPALKELLPPDSNIIRFQKQFEIQDTDWESPWFMDWVYGRHDMPLEELPDHTSLQRNMKKHLLAGGKIGSACGVLPK